MPLLCLSHRLLISVMLSYTHTYSHLAFQPPFLFCLHSPLSSFDRLCRSLLLAFLLSGDQEPRGGAAIYSAGTTTFHERAYFLGNGQYEADANGYEPSNEDGGALSNSGTMTVCVARRQGPLLG